MKISLTAIMLKTGMNFLSFSHPIFQRTTTKLLAAKFINFWCRRNNAREWLLQVLNNLIHASLIWSAQVRAPALSRLGQPAHVSQGQDVTTHCVAIVIRLITDK